MLWKYEAFSADGRPHKGEIEAPDHGGAVQKVRSELGLFAQNITSADEKLDTVFDHEAKEAGASSRPESGPGSQEEVVEPPPPVEASPPAPPVVLPARVQSQKEEDTNVVLPARVIPSPNLAMTHAQLRELSIKTRFESLSRCVADSDDKRSRQQKVIKDGEELALLMLSVVSDQDDAKEAIQKVREAVLVAIAAIAAES